MLWSRIRWLFFVDYHNTTHVGANWRNKARVTYSIKIQSNHIQPNGDIENKHYYCQQSKKHLGVSLTFRFDLGSSWRSRSRVFWLWIFRKRKQIWQTLLSPSNRKSIIKFDIGPFLKVTVKSHNRWGKYYSCKQMKSSVLAFDWHIWHLTLINSKGKGHAYFDS